MGWVGLTQNKALRQLKSGKAWLQENQVKGGKMKKEYELIGKENGRTISCRVFKTEQNAELIREMEMMDYQNAGIKFTVREKEVRQ